MTSIASTADYNIAPSFLCLDKQIAIHGKFRPKEIALIEGSRALDWASYNAIGNRIGSSLRQQGVNKGNRVALLVSNSLWAHELLLGIWRAGAVAVPLSPMLNATTLASMLNDCDASMVFASSDYSDLALASAEICGSLVVSEGQSFSEFLGGTSLRPCTVNHATEDVAVIIYSSGTTGIPKGITHSHAARLNFASVLATQFQVSSHCLALSSIPLYSNGAWLGWLPAKLVGATTIILPRFTPEAFINLVKQHKPSHGFIVPTMCTQLLNHPDIEHAGLSCFEALITAGAPMHASDKKKMMDLTGNGLYELWGLTEGICTIIDPVNMTERLPVVGRPMLGCDMRVIDEHDRDITFMGTGEIVGHSSSMMSGYWNRPEANQALVWTDNNGKRFIRTGDIGEFDAEGFLTLRGRAKDIIISGGINIFPIDIESRLLEHNAVKDASVIGAKHPKWGETPVAFIIKQPSRTTSKDAIKNWANDRLAKYQRLYDLVILEGDFPRNTMGKVLKNRLAKEYKILE